MGKGLSLPLGEMMSRTYFIITISHNAYGEIREKLLAAGFQHALVLDRGVRHEVIDLHGIAVQASDGNVLRGGKGQRMGNEGLLSPDDVAALRTMAAEIEAEWQMGGFVGTIYFEFAVELYRRAWQQSKG